MRKFLFSGALAALLSSALHFYLADRSYDLRAGEAKESAICSISEQVNCDSALLSSYGEIGGVSLSVFGMAASLSLAAVLAALLLGWLAGAFWRAAAFYLSLFIACASIALGLLSLKLQLYCPVCWALYLLSFAAFFASGFGLRGLAAGAAAAGGKSVKAPFFPPLRIVPWLQDRRFWIFLAVAAGSALFLHISFMSAKGVRDIESALRAIKIDWRGESEISFQAAPLIQAHAEAGGISLVEFADFLCPYCARIHPLAQKFLKARRGIVSYRMYVYPLDSKCNPAISFSREGLSCDLSRLAFCAARQEKGKEAVDIIFESQERLVSAAASGGARAAFKDLSKQLASSLSLSQLKLESCLKSPAAARFLKEQAAEGGSAQISGTPSVFVNGRLLRAGRRFEQALQSLERDLRRRPVGQTNKQDAR